MYVEVETDTLLLVTLFWYSIEVSIFVTPWRWRPLAHTCATVKVTPNPSTNISSRGLRQCPLRLVWEDSSGGASQIVLTRLVHFYLFHVSAAPPFNPPHPTCIDH
jgi:hypothetical protein